MDINKTYTSKTGVKRKLLSISECGRFVMVEREYESGKIIISEYWTTIFKERIKNGLWNQ